MVDADLQKQIDDAFAQAFYEAHWQRFTEFCDEIQVGFEKLHDAVKTMAEN